MHTSAIWIYVALLITAHLTSYCSFNANELQSFVTTETAKSMTGSLSDFRKALLPARNVSDLLGKIWKVSPSNVIDCNRTRTDVALILVGYNRLLARVKGHLKDEYEFVNNMHIANAIAQKNEEYQIRKEKLENDCSNATEMEKNMTESLSEKRNKLMAASKPGAGGSDMRQLSNEISEIQYKVPLSTAEKTRACSEYEEFNKEGEPVIVEKKCFASDKYKEVIEERRDDNLDMLWRMVDALTRACKLSQFKLEQIEKYEESLKQRAELLQRQRHILNAFWIGLTRVNAQLSYFARRNSANAATWTLTFMAYCNETLSMNKKIIKQRYGRNFNAIIFTCNDPMTVALPDPLCNKIATTGNIALSSLFNATVYDLLEFTSTRGAFYNAARSYCALYTPHIAAVEENLKECISGSAALNRNRNALKQHTNTQKQLTILKDGLTRVCSKLHTDAIESNAFQKTLNKKK